MRWALALVLLAGCAEGNDVPPPAPDPGLGHDGGAGANDAGTTADAGGATCNAPLASLSGTATFIAGSVVAVNPGAAAYNTGLTCAQWVAGTDWAQWFPDVVMTNGLVHGQAVFALVSGAAATTGCMYQLRESVAAMPGAINCDVTADYALTVP